MNAIRYFFQATKKNVFLWVLVLFLLVGWIIASVFRLVFGETWYESQKNVLIDTTTDKARADVPGSSGSTPFISVWNGTEYKLENDFLFGKPRSYFSSFFEGIREYEANRVFPDLYKIQSPLQLKDGKLTLRIQEIELEESFINGFELLHVAHPSKSEIFVDSEYRKFYAFDREALSDTFIRPLSITSTSGQDVSHITDEKNLWREPQSHEVFNKNDYIDVKFSGLVPGAKYAFAVKSNHRVWMMGEDPSILTQAKYRVASFIKSNIFTRATEASLVFLGLWLTKDHVLSLAPMMGIAIGQISNKNPENNWGGPGSTGGTSGSGYCLPILYKTQSGEYSHVSTVEPRGWLYSSEMVELPRESVLNSGEMTLRVLSTECHHLAFVGLTKVPAEVPCKIENLKLKHAYHHRLKEVVTNSLGYQKGKYLHTIPGDVIDMEFELPRTVLGENESETYMIRAGGFYTYLSPESKKTAGNWEEGISEEAKERLEMLKKTAPRIVRRVG